MPAAAGTPKFEDFCGNNDFDRHPASLVRSIQPRCTLNNFSLSLSLSLSHTHTHIIEKGEGIAFTTFHQRNTLSLRLTMSI